MKKTQWLQSLHGVAFASPRCIQRLGIHAAVAAMLISVPSYAAKLSDVTAESQHWLVASADSQKRVDTLAQQSTNLSDQYRSTLRESEGLRLYIQQLGDQINSQQQEMETVRTETKNLEKTNIEILPLMQGMLGALGDFIKLDMPFLLKDRLARVEKLKSIMPRADVTVSEKYRRIVEAYQIEMDYGRTIEAYTGNLQGKVVDFLRVGRIALMYQTPDGSETGYWDNQKKTWVLDNDYADGVRQGIKIAKKQTSPDLLEIPVPAAKKEG